MLDSLVFGVGGTAGLAYIGCLRALEECDELGNISTIVGCSAGSIIGCLIILGYNSSEIQNIIEQIEFKALFKIELDNIMNIDTDLGLDTGNKLLKLITLFIRFKTGSESTTFAELYSYNPIHFCVGAVCLNTNTLEFFSHKRTPHMPVSLALRMSSSIPIIFTPVKWNGKMYVDGGMLGRYPLQVKCLEHTQCGMGFCISQSNETLLSTDTSNAFIQYITNILLGMYESSQQFEKPHPNITTVHIVPKINGLNFDISSEQKHTIIEVGYTKTREKIIELRLHQYNRIISAQTRIASCIQKKKILGPIQKY